MIQSTLNDQLSKCQCTKPVRNLVCMFTVGEQKRFPGSLRKLGEENARSSRRPSQGYKFESHSLAPQCPALAGLQIQIPQSDSKMLDMVDMFFIILIMLLCKLHVFMFIKEQLICNDSFNKNVWKDTSLYQEGKRIEKDVFLFSNTGGSEEKN